MTKFRIGDQVKIINYGNRGWRYEKIDDNGKLIQLDEPEVFDLNPQLIGQTGIVVKAKKTQNIDDYALFGPEKSAWYHNSQLELIYRPKYERTV